MAASKSSKGKEEGAQSTALAVIGGKEYAMVAHDPRVLGEIIRENLGGQSLKPQDLDRIKVPAGGGTAWEIPTLEGIETAKEVEGIVVAFKEPRAYWATAFDGKNNPPDCYADDGAVGVGSPGGDCSQCPLSQFGSAVPGPDGKPRRGQACKQMRLLFLLRPGSLLPMVVPAPPTSLKPLRQYFLRLSSFGVKYTHLVTKLALEKASNADGINYSRIVATPGTRLDPAQIERVEAYARSIRPALMQVTLEQSDYTETEGPAQGQAQ